MSWQAATKLENVIWNKLKLDVQPPNIKEISNENKDKLVENWN